MVVLLLGLLLAVIALPVSDKGDKKETEGFLKGDSLEEKVTKDQMERKLEDLLSQVEGVGQVKVILTTSQEKGAAVFGEREGERVSGALIAAQGGGNSVVVQNIKQAVMALFQIEAHKIKVMKMI